MNKKLRYDLNFLSKNKNKYSLIIEYINIKIV